MATVATRAPDVVLRGRKVVGGVTEGEVLVTHQTISGWGGVNPMKGEIIETHHELRGQSFAGKILVFPGAKGSSGWSAMFHTTRLTGQERYLAGVSLEWADWHPPRPGWDHDHCEICWWKLVEGDDPSRNAGYTFNGRSWLCTECYEKFVAPERLPHDA